MPYHPKDKQRSPPASSTNSTTTSTNDQTVHLSGLTYLICLCKNPAQQLSCTAKQGTWHAACNVLAFSRLAKILVPFVDYLLTWWCSTLWREPLKDCRCCIHPHQSINRKVVHSFSAKSLLLVSKYKSGLERVLSLLRSGGQWKHFLCFHAFIAFHHQLKMLSILREHLFAVNVLYFVF